MQRLNWVKWYFTDWMIGVRRMSWSARGIYMEALALQFHGERLDVGFEAWQELFPGILEADYWQVVRHFEQREEDDGTVHFVNRRLEAEIQASRVKSDKARANAKRMHSGRIANAERTQSGRSAIRGEERRVEEIRGEQNEVCTDATRRARTVDGLAWTIDAGWVGMTDRDRQDWSVAYPAVNIDQEMAKAHQWLLARPAKQRKKRWRAFLTGWFGRTQEDGGSRGHSRPRRDSADESHIPADVHPDDRAKFFTPDGKRVVYRARKEGKRFVVVADTDGTTVRQHPAYTQVFQPVIAPDGQSVAYGAQDGKKLVWAVEKL